MDKFGHYSPRKSMVHRIDPRIKIMTVIVLSMVILQAESVELMVLGGLITSIALLSYIRLSSLLRTLRPVLAFFTGLFLMYAFFTPGNPVPGFPIGPIVITYTGLGVGAWQVSRFLLLILAAALLTMTTTSTELTIGMEWLLRPIRWVGLSSHNIATMMSLALRFLPLLEEELNTLKEAQLARGSDYNIGLVRGKMRAINYLATPLAINVFRRSDAIIDAMEARGYQPGSRTYLYELRMRPFDYCLLILLVSAVLVQLVICIN